MKMYQYLASGLLATISPWLSGLVGAQTRAEFDRPLPISTACDEEQTDSKIKAVTITNTRNLRFGEILVVGKETAEVYNTTGLNDCPPALWDAMDTAKLAKAHGATRVQQNGPKYWMMDSQTLMLGATTTFDGIDARWAATLPTELLKAEGAKPYRVFKPKKTQRMTYDKGKAVYELVDPQGHVYVLQARGPQFTLESLAELGKQMKQLPSDWNYRTRILSEDLVLDLTPEKTIYAIGDEFHQYYTRIPQSP